MDFLARAGGFDRHAQVDWQRVERLVFVCKGNICRSVYAERKSVSMGLRSISAGLDTRGGAPADAIAQKIALEKGVDLAEHVTRRFPDLDLGRHDLVVAMEPWHMRRSVESMRTPDWQVTLAGLWLNPRRAVIPDPYGDEEEVFRRTFLMLDELISRLLRELPS